MAFRHIHVRTYELRDARFRLRRRAYAWCMPNRMTAVPSGAVPPTGPRMAPVLVVADLFMGAMLSRPGGLSLRTAWVTPGTLLLTCACAPIAAVLAVLLLVRGGWLWSACAVAVLLLGIGSSAVAAVGVSQRRAR